MKLRDLLNGINIVAMEDLTGEEEITGLVYDSRLVKTGCLFTALKGTKTNGLNFIEDAAANGARAVLTSSSRPPVSRLGWIQVNDAREALALASANFYGHPSERLKIVGITGTKGKTTVTYLVEEILKTAGARPGVIGTIEYRFPGASLAASRTTPESPDLQMMLRTMADSGATHCVMEVSSHALEQNRVLGVNFDVAVFTNLSGEHLDYHLTMENYFEAKKKLFFMNHKRNASVVNMDDEWGQKLISVLPMRTITFGFDPAAIISPQKLRLSESGMDFNIVYPGGSMNIQTKLVGKHNVYNILAAAGAALAMNISPSDISQGIQSLVHVPGRFQKIENDRGLLVVVDYAHTDSALENLLLTAREFKPRRIILVFGAGGSRDKGKRERMGRVAARLADFTIITSDNPRDEEPESIIEAIEQGFIKEDSRHYEKIVDREEAINRALSLAEKGDAVIVAGKGHENYQIFKDRTIHFSDVEVIEKILASFKDGK